MMLKALVVIGCVVVGSSVAPAADSDGKAAGGYVAKSARQPLCDALAEWSLQTARSYCYSAWLPDGPVVTAEPGDPIVLADVLRGLGWTMAEADGVAVIARDGDEAKVAGIRKTLLESADESAKRTAAYALSRLTVPSAVAALAEGLADKSPAVQFQCLEALWAIESDWDMRQLPGRVSLLKVAKIKTDPLAALATSAADDKPRRAWRYSVNLLGRAESPLVRPLALAGLKDADPRVRLAAARALRQAAIEQDVEAITEFAETTSDWPAKREAVCAIARLPRLAGRAATRRDDRAAKEMLCLRLDAIATMAMTQPLALAMPKALLRRADADEAAHAADALGRLATIEAEQALVESLAAKEDWRRAAAADGLAVPAKERSAKAVDALIGLKKDESSAARAAAVRALASVAGLAAGDARKAVLEFARDEDPQVRLAVVRALKRIGGAAALDRLHELASDPTGGRKTVSDTVFDDVRREALHALGWLGGVKEAEKLAAIAKDKSLGRDGAEGALLGLGDLLPPAARDIAVATLLELMNDPATCPFPVGRAAIALNDPRLLPGLLKVQAKPRGVGSSLRVDCMDAIGRLGTKQTTEALARNWWEYDNMPRYEGGRALRENLDRGVVHETLLALLKSDPDKSDSQEAAAFSLSNSRDPRAVESLVALLDSRKGAVIGAAIALGMIADPAATGALLAAAKDETHPARFVAARALRMRDLAWQPAVRKTLNSLYGWRDAGTLPSPPPIEEQKPNTWALRRYVRDYGDMSVSELTYESAAAYDSRRGQVLQWGAHGKRYDSPQTGQTWAYDPEANTWAEKGCRELPPGTCMTREICYDSTNDRLIVRGGGGGGHGWLFVREQRIRNSTPWTYDVAADRWHPMRPAPLADFALTHLIEHDAASGVVIGLGRVPPPPATTRPAGAPKPPPPPAKPVIIGVYDTFLNRWDRPATQPDAPTANFATIAYDSRRGRMLFAGEGVLWSYSLAENRWTDLKPGGDAPKDAAPMVYDSVNDVALTFRAGIKGTTVFAYDPATNAWSSHKVEGMLPDHHNWDAAFDEKHNVVVVCGGEITSCPGSPNVRETWTYRFGPGKGDRPLAPPGRATATIDKNEIRIVWAPSPDKRVVGYLVSRAAGEKAWGVKVEPLNGGKPVVEARLLDTAPLSGPATYVVQSVDAAGNKSVARAIARTLPAAPVGVVATWSADRKARVTWDKSAAGDVVGYNVYRAPVSVGSMLADNPIALRGPFARLNAAPVAENEFVDPEEASRTQPGTRPDEPLPAGWVFASRAYMVRAVNAAGIESGPSAWAATLPATPKRIEVRRRDDGSVVVRWEEDPNPDVAGYVVYRMDNWRGAIAKRVNTVPVATTTLIDSATEGARPSGERQRYWVVGVDKQGQEGPSGTGAWSFNR